MSFVIAVRDRLRRALDAFREFNAANIELWERYLQAQRPWEATWLHWVCTPQGWRLEGSVLPPPRRSPAQTDKGGRWAHCR